MKPFDLQRAIAGEKLVTRDGQEVTHFVYFAGATKDRYKCRAVVDFELESFTEKGGFEAQEHALDLFMAPKTRTVYVNIYDHPGITDEPMKGTKAYAFNNEADARDNEKKASWGLLVVAHPVVIEE